MVDLVKIRKKAKKKEAAEEQQGAAPPAAAAEEPEQVASPPSRPSAAEADPDPAAVAPPAPHTSKLDRFKEQAGRRRDVTAGTGAEETAPEAQLELLTFVIAGEQYAADIERIVEIVTPRALTRIPNADHSIMGIMSLRGTIVTLLDVRRKLGHPPAGAAGEETRIIVIDFRNETVGFIVDRVLRVVKAQEVEVEPHPVVHVAELDESIRGVFRASGALTILLDLDKLLDHTALAARTA